MRIGVVIVTYNRRNKLKKTLDSFQNQTLTPEYIIVVNNASNDGTEEFLKEWAQEKTDYRKIIINKNTNTGGSGGFYTGLKEAVKLDADWIWVSDDDAYPDANALKNAYAFLAKRKSKIAAICGAVYTNNTIDESHRRVVRKGLFKIHESNVPKEKYSSPFFEINEFSYVGSIICKKALLDKGLTKKEYFIHYDDTEHSLRLNKWGKIFCVPEIKIIHDITTTQNSQDEKYNSSWQKYYDYRNLLDTYKENFPKRYYIIQYFIYRIKTFFPKMFNLTNVENDILKSSLYDFKHGRYGIHEKYRPGFVGR